MARLIDRIARLEATSHWPACREASEAVWIRYAAWQASLVVEVFAPTGDDLITRLYQGIAAANAPSDRLSPIRGSLRTRLDTAEYKADDLAHGSRSDGDQGSLGRRFVEPFRALLPGRHPELIGLPSAATYLGEICDRKWGYRVESGKLWFEGKEVVGPHLIAFGVDVTRGKVEPSDDIEEGIAPTLNVGVL